MRSRNTLAVRLRGKVVKDDLLQPRTRSKTINRVDETRRWIWSYEILSTCQEVLDEREGCIL